MGGDKRSRSRSPNRHERHRSRSREDYSRQRDKSPIFSNTSSEINRNTSSNRNDADNDGFMDLMKHTTQHVSRKDRQVQRLEESLKTREIGQSSRELNPQFKQSDSIPQATKRNFEFGDSGSNWRMMKVKRVLETAREEGRDVLEVALERYASKELWEEALAEKKFLDAKKGPAPAIPTVAPPPSTTAVGKFKKPEKRMQEPRMAQPRMDQPPLRPAGIPMRNSPSLPTVDRTLSPFPTIPTPSSSSPVLSKDELNRLKSQALKAKLMKAPNAQELNDKFEMENSRAEQAAKMEDVVVLPTIDSTGRMVDLAADVHRPQPGESRKRKKERIQKMEAESEDASLESLVRQERIGQRWDMDADMASRIAKDVMFQNDLEYMDDAAEKIGKKSIKSETQKRQAAIHDHKKTQEALQKCNFCYHDGSPPNATVISLGNKTYLGLPLDVDMVPGHCVIVPIQHAITTLELDDDVWDEIRNFQKCLIQRFASEGKGVIFMETVPNLKWHRHTIIECIPVPMDLADDAPAYFKDALLSVEDEWSQHQKVLDTSKNGFRRSMVKNLPYFHVWFDPNRGYGHVIEGEKREFPGWFGREVLAGMMDIGPELWRRPRRANGEENVRRKIAFKKGWDAYDWTKMLDEQ